MNRGQISAILRRLGLIFFTDRLRYQLEKYRNRKINRAFIASHPDLKLPPDYLIYESFQINYHRYYTESMGTAEWLAGHFRKHISLENRRILDWGCGPGRVIRHLPEYCGKGCTFYGTDYNEQSIDWCKKNLPGIHFNKNSLEARLPFEDDYMDIIYGISIFTHLSEKKHFEWYKELFRILKPGGIMFLTTQGDNFRVKLTGTELKRYDEGEIIVRGRVKEGHRTFSAFHPKAFMHKLFSGVEILDHMVRKGEKGRALPQDIWIIRKR